MPYVYFMFIYNIVIINLYIYVITFPLQEVLSINRSLKVNKMKNYTIM